jgi:hypothetical protein
MKVTLIARALAGGLALLAMAGAANATLIVRPTTDHVTSSNASSCDKACVESVFGAIGTTLLYQGTDRQSDGGTYANSYWSDFSDSNSSPTNAIIEYTGGSDIDCGYCYLVVRRDNNAGYYFYDLGKWGDWDGREDLEWRGSTLIDRIQIYGGGSKVKVPEPATLSLFGLSLLGIGLMRRRKRS